MVFPQGIREAAKVKVILQFGVGVGVGVVEGRGNFPAHIRKRGAVFEWDKGSFNGPFDFREEEARKDS